MRSIALALLFVASPAFAADQFDLVCTGKSIAAHYRIDLARGEACDGACDRIWKMGDATSSELRIVDLPSRFRDEVAERSIVNRQTGAWHYYLSASGEPDGYEGHCEPAPFTGFPAAKF